MAENVSCSLLRVRIRSTRLLPSAAMFSSFSAELWLLLGPCAGGVRAGDGSDASDSIQSRFRFAGKLDSCERGGMSARQSLGS